MTSSTLRLFHGGVHRNGCSYVLHELPTTDLDILTAYGYFHGREIDEGFQLIMTEKLKVTGIVRSHFLDSGSFTLWTRAAKYAKEHGCGKWDYYDTPEFWEYMQDYVDFIKKYKIGIDLYANVDVIPNAELSWRNLKWLEKQGLRPVPVVHYRTPIKELARHIDAGYDLIGLGGLVGSTRQEECRRWLEACFDLVCDTPDRLPKVRIHGFGVTNYDLMLRYPWYCMTEEDHEVLTRQGWKHYRELVVGEDILCYEDGKSTWQPILEIPSFDVVNVDLIHLYNKKIKGVDAYVTWNHRWRVVDLDDNTKFSWKETHELGTTHAIPRVGDYVDAPTQKQFSDELVELAAWFWTEGRIKARKKYKTPSITISQSLSANPEKVCRIRALLDRLDEKYCENVAVRPCPDKKPSREVTFELYGSARDWLLESFPEKRLSYDFILSLTKEQLELFVDVSIMADGWKGIMSGSENSHSYLRQKDDKNIDQFQVACLLAGYVTSGRMAYHKPSDRDMSEVRACRTASNRFAWVKTMEREVIRYTGRLWCVRVPSQAFFTRCNGCVYVTGNSVDSTSWTKVGAYGGIIVPGTRSGEFVFNDPDPKRRPYVVKVSDEIPKKDLNKPKRAGLRQSDEEQVPARDIGREYHFRGLSHYRKECVLRWLDSIGVPFGKNDPKTGEVIEYGVCNRHTERRAANLFFFEAMKKAIPEYPWPYIPKHPVPQEFQVQRKKGLLP